MTEHGGDGLRRTPLHGWHTSNGGRMTPFGGWDMPIQYASILQEARAVRGGAGMFDVSHMGRLRIEGDGAAALLSATLSVDAGAMRVGRARYNLICNEGGGIIDDCIVYRTAADRYLLVPNAANTGAVADWLARWNAGFGADIRDITADTAMIAVQGPLAAGIVGALSDGDDIVGLRPFAAASGRVGGVDAFAGRTGYTGEDGFELTVAAGDAVRVWELLADAGAAPCGLGARDVLRLEAGLLLHGNDMDAGTNPYEAGLGRFVSPDRDGYVAREALTRLRDEGTARALVGFTMVGRGIPRRGCAISVGGDVVGEVTSGGPSVALDTSIGLGYVPTEFSDIGTRLHIDIRGRLVEAVAARVPFYTRSRD